MSVFVHVQVSECAIIYYSIRTLAIIVRIELNENRSVCLCAHIINPVSECVGIHVRVCVCVCMYTF